jgi:hypothetical protein
MTFPVETKDPQQGRIRIAKAVQSAVSHNAAFYAYMTVGSAHRIIISGRCSDITISGKNIDRHLFDHDYFFMKAKAIDFLNQMMRDSGQATSDGAFEAVSTLLTCAV